MNDRVAAEPCLFVASQPDAAVDLLPTNPRIHPDHVRVVPAHTWLRTIEDGPRRALVRSVFPSVDTASTTAHFVLAVEVFFNALPA